MNITPPALGLSFRCKKCGQQTAVIPLLVPAALRHGILCHDCMPSKAKTTTVIWTKAAYADYLKSEHWQKFRLKALDYYGRKCYLCNATEHIELHHNTYERIGGEEIGDVIPLCRDCHEAVTAVLKERKL